MMMKCNSMKLEVIHIIIDTFFIPYQLCIYIYIYIYILLKIHINYIFLLDDYTKNQAEVVVAKG